MSDCVGLNVGGKVYRTSRLTLTRYPDSFFPRLLDGGIPSNKDDQGNYLIDQDGKIFRHVLNFLRYGELELPEGFREFGLLKRQADFFLLEAFKESIGRHLSGIGLVFYDGKLFNTTKEILSKEVGSFFTKMLKGEVAVERDPQGNFIMERDGSAFHHILNYLRDGGVFKPVTSADLDRLEDDAEYFGLKVFASHIQSIRTVGNDTSSCTHFYWCPPAPCVAYSFGLAHLHSAHKAQVEARFEKTFTIIDGRDDVMSGVLNLDVMNPNGPATLKDIEDYYKRHEFSVMETIWPRWTQIQSQSLLKRKVWPLRTQIPGQRLRPTWIPGQQGLILGQ